MRIRRPVMGNEGFGHRFQACICAAVGLPMNAQPDEALGIHATSMLAGGGQFMLSAAFSF